MGEHLPKPLYSTVVKEAVKKTEEEATKKQEADEVS